MLGNATHLPSRGSQPNLKTAPETNKQISFRQEKLDKILSAQWSSIYLFFNVYGGHVFSLMDINASPFLSRMPRYRHLRQMDFELSITHLHPYSLQVTVQKRSFRLWAGPAWTQRWYFKGTDLAHCWHSEIPQSLGLICGQYKLVSILLSWIGNVSISCFTYVQHKLYCFPEIQILPVSQPILVDARLIKRVFHTFELAKSFDHQWKFFVQIFN